MKAMENVIGPFCRILFDYNVMNDIKIAYLYILFYATPLHIVMWLMLKEIQNCDNRSSLKQSFGSNESCFLRIRFD